MIVHLLRLNHIAILETQCAATGSAGFNFRVLKSAPLQFPPPHQPVEEPAMSNQPHFYLERTVGGGLPTQGGRAAGGARFYNGMIDKRPRLIARCADAADVITAVNFARNEGLLLAIRGGGHNGPGLGSCNDGLVIDLSMLKSVRVDAATGPSASSRLHVGRCRSRDARVRSGRAVRYRLHHRRRRPHARRRHRLSDASPRSDDRQSSRSRRRACRWQLRHRQQVTAS